MAKGKPTYEVMARLTIQASTIDDVLQLCDELSADEDLVPGAELVGVETIGNPKKIPLPRPMVPGIVLPREAKDAPIAAKRCYETRFVLRVLSEAPIDPEISLDDLLVEMDMGGYVGRVQEYVSEEITEAEVRERLVQFGSDEDFFVDD